MTFTDNFIVECTNIERSLKNQQFHKLKQQKKHSDFYFFREFVFFSNSEKKITFQPIIIIIPVSHSN